MKYLYDLYILNEIYIQQTLIYLKESYSCIMKLKLKKFRISNNSIECQTMRVKNLQINLENISSLTRYANV